MRRTGVGAVVPGSTTGASSSLVSANAVSSSAGVDREHHRLRPLPAWSTTGAPESPGVEVRGEHEHRRGGSAWCGRCRCRGRRSARRCAPAWAAAARRPGARDRADHAGLAVGPSCSGSSREVVDAQHREVAAGVEAHDAWRRAGRRRRGRPTCRVSPATTCAFVTTRSRRDDEAGAVLDLVARLRPRRARPTARTRGVDRRGQDVGGGVPTSSALSASLEDLRVRRLGDHPAELLQRRRLGRARRARSWRRALEPSRRAGRPARRRSQRREEQPQEDERAERAEHAPGDPVDRSARASALESRAWTDRADREADRLAEQPEADHEGEHREQATARRRTPASAVGEVAG